MHRSSDKAFVFLMFDSLDCAQCRKYGTLMAKLAKHTQGSPQVARTNCNLSGKAVCKAFGTLEGMVPRFMVFEGRSVYEFTLPTDETSLV